MVAKKSLDRFMIYVRSTDNIWHKQEFKVTTKPEEGKRPLCLHEGFGGPKGKGCVQFYNAF